MTLRAKVPTEVTVCSSCGRNVSTDGVIVRCEAGHELHVEAVTSQKRRRWFRQFNEWATLSEGSTRD